MYPNQSKALVNYIPMPSIGLKDRPPTEHISKLMNPLITHPLIHTIIKENEKYKVYLTGSDIKVFDLNGNEKTVNVVTSSTETDTITETENVTAVTPSNYSTNNRYYIINSISDFEFVIRYTVDSVSHVDWYKFTVQNKTYYVPLVLINNATDEWQRPVPVYDNYGQYDPINYNYSNCNIVGRLQAHITNGQTLSSLTSVKLFTYKTEISGLDYSVYTLGTLATGAFLCTDSNLTSRIGQVTEINGTTIKYTAFNSLSYVTTTNPLKDLTATTIADYTFITNKTVNTAMVDENYPNPYPNAALIFVKQGDYGIDYIVKVNGTQVASKTTSSSDISDHRTNIIADALYSGLVTNLGTTDWNISKLNSCIVLAKKDGSAFTIQTTDSNADRSLFSFYKETKAITDLPIAAPNGFILKIIGEKGDTSDDYYVQFSTADGSTFGIGTWKECCSPDVKYKVNASTMPHVLVRESDGTFTFKQVEWTNRKAGDETTAKTPSIFGNPIEEVFTYKGRLAFVAGDRSLYSDVDDIFSLFKRTVMTSLDTDPIDVGSNSKMVLLKHSLAFNEDLLLFSPTSVFNITSGDTFSNSTVGIDLTMEYPCSSICKPICIGGTALFAHDNGIYSGIYELYVASTYTKAARSITEQIPCYLPAGMYKMTANVENNIVCLLNKNIKNKIYVYNYYYSSEQKAQSAWHEWHFAGDILGADFVDNYLYLSIQYDDGVYLEKLDITPVQHETGLDYLIYLDRKVYFNNIEDDEILIPYISDNEFQIINEKGIPVTYTLDTTTNKATLTSDYESIIVGFPFESKFQLGNIYQRQTTETGTKVIEGLLMLKDITLNYLNTGYFKVITTPHYTTMHTSNLDTGTLRMVDEVYGESSSFEFTGVILATISATLGKVSVSNGSFLFPVMAKNEDMDIEVVNDSYLPSTFTSLVWIGDFNIRGKDR
jgi:hypothetical protein